ncbi:MAG: hypothetical protein OIF32_04545 [Campylobacterales bacterium]|nr:hypothetical protein [Campylobacterales bacterium]
MNISSVSRSQTNNTHITRVSKSYKPEHQTVVKVSDIPQVDFSSKKPLIDYKTPHLFVIPKDRKHEFINDALYNDEKRLLQVLYNEVTRTPIGKELQGAFNVLKANNAITFYDSRYDIDAHGRFSICDDCSGKIVVAKDSSIAFLSATIVHELTHYLDFYLKKQETLQEKKYMVRLNTEINAFANEQRFFIESGVNKSFAYKMLGDDTVELLESAYKHRYNNEFSKSHIKSLLENYGYEGLDDEKFIDCE